MTDVETPGALLTAEQFFLLSGGGRKQELVAGRVVTTSPTGGEHGDVHIELAMRLRLHAKSQGLGWVTVETGFLLRREPDLVRAPDVAFVVAARAPRPAPKGFVQLAPDLAVEVVSPSDTDTEVREKVDEYLTHGVREVWLVDPRRRRAEVFRRGAAPAVLGPEGALATDLLPGLSIPLAELF